MLEFKNNLKLKYIRPIMWQDVFENWKKGEVYQESWKQYWQERGFDSWDEWRQAYVKPIEPEKLTWYLYEIEDPIDIVGEFFGVPSKGWMQKAYDGEKTKKLKDILNLQIIKEYDKVAAIKKDFPPETMLTAVLFKGEVILIEGMHRASAIASWDKTRDFSSKITLAIAQFNKSEIPVLGGNYKNN